MASSKEVQDHIDIGLGFLMKTTSSASQMIKSHGIDWTKWPKDSNWYKGMVELNEARKDASLFDLTLTADFTSKVL